jgi:hypothetical protein
VSVALADFRFADNRQDFILDQWQTVDLSPLAGARSVGLTFESTDVGDFGFNTPTYLAMDNIRLSAVPEPSGRGLIAGVAIGMLGLIRRRRGELLRG